MSYVCEVCNGMTALTVECQSCHAPANDQGKLSDYYGPYSPYRPADELKAANGFEDLASHQCIHVAFCPQCANTFYSAVQEQPNP
ncbi:hypothetical protein [Paenibacillus cremeus]|uniref:Uncharacterized protein n=1 Tax=Paenibacillus cremeus TaxID=2163881 RepID=A0A559KEG4_9BACL|nr:hypothetical protein [Paenibacillus cremeus]TVY10515.1 hypothetical protein FPZ49_07195 [Paenibacillus cremeus]